MPPSTAVQRRSIGSIDISVDCKKDEPAEPIAGSERPKGFNQCLLLIARAHEQEIQQLAALRAENALLKNQLASAGIPDEGVPEIAEEGVPEVVSPTDVKQPSEMLQPGGGSDKIPAVEAAQELPGPSSDCEAFSQSEGSLQSAPFLPQLSERSLRKATCTSYSLRETWQITVDDVQMARCASRRSIHLARSKAIVIPDEPEEVRFGIQRFISYPGSPGRLLWDLMGAVLILFDLFTIPLDAFSPPRTSFMTVMDWSTLVFWTLNMPLSLQVGVVKGGETIMDVRRILVIYLRTWFIIDVIVVLPDWIFTFASLGEEDDGNPNSMKLLRVLRLVRMVRLLRLLKLQRIIRSLTELIETEYASIIANIVKMIVLLLVINHYIGCLWYLVGTSQEDGVDTWVTYHRFDKVGWGYKYLTSFHWAITQFTPASMHVQPQNPLERAFAILVVVFALVGFSYVVGSITGSLAQLRSMQEDTYKQFWILRRYLKHNKVPHVLSSRIQRYLEHAWQSQRQTLNLHSSKLFSLLSEQLHSELQYEICLPFLRVHKLFSELSQVSGMTMRRIAWNAMQRKLLATDDDLFILGEDATHMYVLVNGRMEYRKADALSAQMSCPCGEYGKTGALDSDVQKVESCEDIISEPILWTPAWVHLGTLTATKETEVLMLEPKKFSDIIHRSPPALMNTMLYAKEYVAHLNSLDADLLSDIINDDGKDRKSQRSRGAWSTKPAFSLFQRNRPSASSADAPVA